MQPLVKSVQHRHPYEKEYHYAGVVLSGDLAFVSGIVSLGPDGQVVAPGDMAQQIDVVYRGVQETLALVGATLDDVVKETIHTTDLDAFLAAMPVRAKYYAGISLPASAAWHEVVRLVHPDFLVEVEVIARVPSAR